MAWGSCLIYSIVELIQNIYIYIYREGELSLVPWYNFPFSVFKWTNWSSRHGCQHYCRCKHLWQVPFLCWLGGFFTLLTWFRTSRALGISWTDVMHWFTLAFDLISMKKSVCILVVDFGRKWPLAFWVKRGGEVFFFFFG